MGLDHFLQLTVVVLGAAVVVLLVCHRLRVAPLVDLAIEAGDNLVLVGSHAEVDSAFETLLGRGAGRGLAP